MQFRINEIGLFQENKKDIIKFNEDINFISGDSNTGKSSIGEIIDYCLASSKLTIPQGKIVNEVDIFAINVTINNHNILIARNRYNNVQKEGKKYIFLKEINNGFSLSKIEKSWFNKYDLHYMTLSDFKELEIIKYFPTFPPKTRLDGKEMVRPTIRSMIPFMFQTQDIIKNKTQLFYEMNKPTKVKNIKRDFELFLGLVNFSIYTKINRKNELIKEIKKIKNRTNLYEDELKKEYQNLKSHYFRLFSHLNKNIDIDVVDLQDLKSKEYLEEYHIEYNMDSDILKQIDEVETKVNQQSRIVESVKIEYSNVKNKIKHIDTAQNELQHFTNMKDYEAQCPICNSYIEKSFDTFTKAKQKIKEEQKFLNSYNVDILRDKEKELHVKLQQEKEKLLRISKELKILTRDVKEIKDIESKKNILAEIKGMIKQTIKQIKHYENNIEKQDKLQELEKELENLDKELKKIDLKKKRYEAEYLIGSFATDVLKKLHFDEKDYGTPNLKFDIKDISMYQQGEKDIYYLSDLGSAENHLSFHLATFLGLHRYILEHKESILPSLIFLDQPSQVYFPKEEDFKNGTGDIQKVEDIYQVIIEFIENLNSLSLKSNIQIIIVDHFYNQEEWFQKYLIEPRWDKNKGLGLIKSGK